ncbi:MAG: cbb3-type cytochrome c oxidase subunit 3 [Chryseobacterium sp.]|nr:MAG: cbb3-type cytochrome c oxidase subunit 3 [Chryseobacterium sp.]
MIPQNFKDILSSQDNAGLYQSLALILFVIFFVALVVSVFRKPKKYYRDEANAPLDDSTENNDLK